MKLNIENIFIDLDGTALRSDKLISSTTTTIIKDLQNKNINIFVATGRPPYMIKQELKLLNIHELVICVNGGMIINTNENKIINIEKIDYPSAQKIEFFLKKNNLPYLIYTDKEMYYNCSESNTWIKYLKDRISILDNEYKWNLTKIDDSYNLENHNIVKFLIPTFSLEKDLIDKLYLLFEKEITSCKLVQSQEDILDIIPSHSSKGVGIKYIANLLSLDLDKTLAFGDANNDIPMFQTVKYSVAMGNAVNDLKKVATYITKSNDEDGIYNFIKEKVL